jgi:YVTN family beta-propeller protein
VARGRVSAHTRLPFTASALAAGGGGVWLVDKLGESLVRVEPATSAIVARIHVGREPRAVAVGSGAVWVANFRDGTVSRIDPNRNAVERTIPVRSHPIDVEVGVGAVWVVRRTDDGRLTDKS